MNDAFAMVQEADVADAMVILKARAPGRTLVIVVTGRPEAASITDTETRRKAFGGRVPAGARFDRRASEALVGAKILGKGRAHVDLELPSGELRSLEARGGLVRLGPPRERGEPVATATEATRREWQLEAEQALAGVSAAVARADALLVDRALRKAEARLERRAVAIAGDISKMSAVTALAARAVNLVPAARKAKRGETELRGPDYENGGEIVLPLDPGKAPQAQLESLFARAKRMKAGREAAEARLSETRRALEALRAIRATLAEAPSLDAEQIADLRNRAKAVAPKDVSFGAEGTAKSSRGAPQKHNAFRRFRTPRGLLVLVGKGSADNDELTFRIASPHDLWLHAKDRRGAHVIVPLRKSEALPDGALVDAATLAAHFSDARDEALVDVQYTSRKYVRKMKGGAAGAVVVEREKVLVLRVDKGKVAELLDGEEA